MGTDVEVGITESIAHIYIFNEERGAWVQKDFKDFIFEIQILSLIFEVNLKIFYEGFPNGFSFDCKGIFSVSQPLDEESTVEYFLILMFKNNPTIVQPPICNIIFNQLRLRILKETKIFRFFQTFHC